MLVHQYLSAIFTKGDNFHFAFPGDESLSNWNLLKKRLCSWKIIFVSLRMDDLQFFHPLKQYFSHMRMMGGWWWKTVYNETPFTIEKLPTCSGPSFLNLTIKSWWKFHHISCFSEGDSATGGKMSMMWHRGRGGLTLKGKNHFLLTINPFSRIF